MEAHVRRLAVVLAATVLGAFPAVPASAAGVPSGPVSVTAEADGLALRVDWTPPTDRTGITGYRVSTVPAGFSLDLPADADHAVLAGVRPNTGYVAQVTALAGAEQSAPTRAGDAVTLTAPAVTGRPPPARLLDTRSGLGAPAGATRKATLAVAGRGGIPPRERRRWR